MNHRILALMLLPVALLSWAADTNTIPGQTAASPDTAALWKASVDAEINKNYDDALAQLRSYLAGGGDKYMATLRAGWLMYLKGEYPGAALNYGNASRMQPNAISPLLGLMYVAIAGGDRAKITQAADNVLRIEPTNYKAQVAIAEVSYSSGDYRRARSQYRRVLTVYPEDQYAISGAAWSALLSGEKNEALEGFKKRRFRVRSG